MSIKQSVLAYLLTKTGVTSLVVDRIYTGLRPQGEALPAITIHKISAGPEHDLDGAAGNANPRIQIDCWAGTDLEADALAEAVRNAMDGFTGTMGSHHIDVALLDDGSDDQAVPIDGSDVSTYRVTQDYLIRHTESQPTFT